MGTDYGRAWPVSPQLYLAGADTQEWDLGVPQVTVVCLRRRIPCLADYGPIGGHVIVLHRPFPYWELPDPLEVLECLAAEVSALAHRGVTVVHCALGLDRTAVVGLAVLILTGLDFDTAYARYALRGVRPPRADALALVAAFAIRQQAA